MAALAPHIVGRVGRTDLPLIVANDRRRLLGASPAALELLGITKAELRGHAVDDFVPEAERPHVPSLWWALTRGGSLAGRLPLETADGRKLVVDFVATFDHHRNEHLTWLIPVLDERGGEGRRRARRPLSQRELEILALVSRGYTGAQIAELLHLSESTIDTHVRRAIQAMGATNRVHAVALAIGRGLLNAPI
jgi:DNA-binding CsgD family transcriptional regulator